MGKIVGQQNAAYFIFYYNGEKRGKEERKREKPQFERSEVRGELPARVLW